MPEQLEKYRKIMDLYWFINGLKKDQQREFNRPTVFINCVGHVGWIEVEIYPEGWYPDYCHKSVACVGQKTVWPDKVKYSLESSTPYEVWDECIKELEDILDRCRNGCCERAQTAEQEVQDELPRASD